MALTTINKKDNSVIHANEYKTNSFDSHNLIEEEKVINSPIGKGLMKHWFFEGIRMAYSDWRFREAVTTEWKNDLDVVCLNFNLKGNVSIKNKVFGNTINLKGLQHNMYYSNGFEGIVHNEELVSTFFMIQFTKGSFLKITQDANDTIKRFAEQILSGVPVLLTFDNLFIDIPMNDAIQAIINCRYKDGMKKMFLLSKCIELLVLQADSLNRINAPKNTYCKTEYDKERVIIARDYLIQHIDAPPSLSELAKIACINEYKLKKGFKEIFNNTVFGYLSDIRLDLAKKKLESGEKKPSQLAIDLGYASLQHFSLAFKKKFGVSPRQLTR